MPEEPGEGGAKADGRARGCALNVWPVLGVALALRGFAAWFSMHAMAKDWFWTRGLEMSFMADALVRGRGLAAPFGGNTGPTAMFAPVYPLFVAAVFRVFGSYTRSSAWAVLAVQAVVGVATIALMMDMAGRVAGRVYGRSVALIAGWAWALSVPLWWVPTIFWDTTFTTAMLMAVIALALRVVERPRLKMWVGLGGLCGVAALLNPALVPTLAALLAVIAAATWKAGGALRATIAVVTMLAVFSVWPVRNARVFGAFIPLRTAPGLDLWMGNYAGARGYVDKSVFPIDNKAELAAYEKEGEVAYTARKGMEAREYIEGHPGGFAKLTAKRVVRFWAGTGSEDGSALFMIHAVLTTTLGLAGWWMLVRQRRWWVAWIVAVPLVLFPLPYYVTHAEFRFRLVIDPLLTVLAAYGIVEWWKRREMKVH